MASGAGSRSEGFKASELSLKLGTWAPALDLGRPAYEGERPNTISPQSLNLRVSRTVRAAVRVALGSLAVSLTMKTRMRMRTKGEAVRGKRRTSQMASEVHRFPLDIKSLCLALVSLL